MPAITPPLRSALVSILLLASFGCTSETGPGEATVVDLDSKSDIELRLELGKLDMFRVACDLEVCRFRLDLDGVDGAISVATGAEGAIRAHRDAVLADGSATTAGVDVQSVTAEGGVATAFFEVPNGDFYGTAYGADASADAVLRLVPDLDGATGLPQEDLGAYGVRSVVSADAHQWTVPVADVFSFFDPTVSVALTGDQSQLSLAVYYTCTSDGTTFMAPEPELTRLSREVSFAPDCPTTDDGGFVYVEVDGLPGYDTSYSLLVSVDGG